MLYGVYVGNIDSSVSLEMVKQCFSQCGVIAHSALHGKNTDPYRYGFVRYKTDEERNRALQLNGFTLAGRALKVGVCKDQPKKPDANFISLSAGIQNPHTLALLAQQQLIGNQGISNAHCLPSLLNTIPTIPQAQSMYPQTIQSQTTMQDNNTSNSVNQPPSSELLAQREVQRMQFFNIINTETQKYISTYFIDLTLPVSKQVPMKKKRQRVVNNV